MATSRLTEQLGRVLGGRYRLNAPIGSGASAQVYLADDVTLRRRVAVKVLHPALADDAAFLRRFRAEARAAAALNHPNLMAVYDWGEDDGPYLVLEFLGGGSLRAMLDQGRRLTPSQALVVGLDTARALHFAHRRDVVHRDIKPANLLFGDDGRLRIADFGLARALSEAAWTEPGDGLVGTVRYAAPEQAKNGRVDGRADVYALALVLIEAVTGSVPLIADSSLATLAGRADTPVPVPAALGPLVAVLERAGRPDPAERPDAGELGQALLAAARHLDRPDPLPLVGAVDLASVREASDADPTLLPPSHPVSVADLDATAMTVAGSGGDNGDNRDRGGVGGETMMMSGPPTAVFDLDVFDLEVFDRATSSAPVLFDDAGIDSGEAPRRRRRWPYLLVLLVLVGAALGGAFAYLEAQPATAQMPNVDDDPEAAAVAELQRVQTEAGFEIPWEVRIERDFDDNIPEGDVITQRPSAGRVLEEGEVVTLVVSQGLPFTTVPALDGLTADQAEAELVEAQLTLGAVRPVASETVDAGLVLEWSSEGVERPPELREGSAVDVVVSEGPAPRTVPPLAGLTRDQAVAELKAAGLGAEVATRFDDEVDEGVVIGSEPGSGATVERGTTVTVVVSRGRDVVTVPDLVGRTLEELNKALEDAGLRSGDVSGNASGSPAATDPESGAVVDRGTAVDIFLRR
ncbi:MAG: serine/threonine protein kinase [Acidimicrobiia bacterium]|nr:serine/threonine protein kinase [Acidimicrobiia bacterium]